MNQADAVVIGHLALQVKELEGRINHLHTSLICAFNQLLDLKDMNTGCHSTRLAEWAIRVGQELGMDEKGLRNVEVAALLHDIGKVGVPDAILHKQGKLTDDGWGLMKKHPEYGWAVVRLFPELERASLFILHHHERFDGGGYPGGLRGDEIPLGARIVAVIDAFDSMISNRPYRQGLPFDEAISRLSQGRGTQFDPEVVDCFVKFVRDEECQQVFAATGTGRSLSV